MRQDLGPAAYITANAVLMAARRTHIDHRNSEGAECRKLYDAQLYSTACSKDVGGMLRSDATADTGCLLDAEPKQIDVVMVMTKCEWIALQNISEMKVC